MGRARAAGLALSAGRAGLGLAALAAPEVTARALGFGAADLTPGALTLVRLLGVRDLGIGAASVAWLGLRPPTRALALLNCAVDSGDAAVGLLGLARGRGATGASAVTILVAAPVAAAWARLARSPGGAPAATGPPAG